MTQPLVDPEAFLRQSPQDFLADNLPSVVEPMGAAEANHHRLAIALGGAFIGWRLLSARAASQVEPHESMLARLADQVTRPLWLKLATPTIDEVFARAGASGSMAAAASMGEYLHSSSTAAALGGFRAELAAGRAPALAWGRAALGYGLDERSMRGWLIGQREGQETYASEFVSPGARRALDKMVLRRADIFGQTEAASLIQTAATLGWIEKEDTGALPPGTRKTWITADDEMVCSVCGPLHRQSVPLRERFELPSGDTVWAPGIHPNCRCQLELNTSMQLLVEKRMPRTIILKALGKDRFNRDSDGHFASRESRRPRLQVLDRPAPVLAPPVPDVEQETELVPTFVDPYADVETDPYAVVTADPYAVALVDPYAEIKTDPYAEAKTDPYAPKPETKAGAGSRKIIIIRNGKPEELEDDRLILGSTDWYTSVMSDHRYGLRAMSSDSTLSGSQEGRFAEGDIIDFDQWHDKMDIDAPGFTVESVPTGYGAGPLLDLINYSSSEVSMDEISWERSAEDYYDYQQTFFGEAERSSSEDIPRLRDQEIVAIYTEAGMTQQLRDFSTSELREQLAQVFERGYEGDNDDGQFLMMAYLDHRVSHDAEAQSYEAAINEDPGAQPFVVPQLFSFRGGRFTPSSRAGSNALHATGRYRVAGVRVHLLGGNYGTRTAYNQEGNRYRTPSHPQVPKWREVVLEPIDDNRPEDHLGNR